MNICCYILLGTFGLALSSTSQNNTTSTSITEDIIVSEDLLTESCTQKNQHNNLKVLLFDTKNVSQETLVRISDELSQEIRSIVKLEEYVKSGNDIYVVYSHSEHEKLMDQYIKNGELNENNPLIEHIVIGTINKNRIKSVIFCKIGKT